MKEKILARYKSKSNNFPNNKKFIKTELSNDNKERKNNCGCNEKVEIKNYPILISRNELSKLIIENNYHIIIFNYNS